MLDDPLLFDPATTDFAPVVTKMMSKNPDIISLDTAYADYVHPICEQLFQQGYKGQIISCTADFYEKIIEKTSKEFMEGFIFQFPDFDDPALNQPQINFQRPNEFYAEYAKRHPGEWGAVSWEYASIMDLWYEGAQKAGSVEPFAVLKAMKADGTGKHAFGTAKWWGKDLFGIDNALVGDWPVVVIENGKAVIKEFKLDWLKEEGGVSGMEAKNNAKAKLIYDIIDGTDFYIGAAHPEHRSIMNVTFNLANNDLLDDFLAGALNHGLYALKGHRAVGGARASIYNAMPIEGCQALVDFMTEFERSNG